MKRIERLTTEQVARMAEFRDKWIAIGLSTEPADRPAAEAAIRESYKAAGLDEPARIVWCGSPLSQGLTRAIILDPPPELRRAVVATETGASVRASVWASVWASVGASVRASVWDSVGASVRASVWASVWASVGDSVWASVGDSVYGQHDACWLAFYEFLREVCGLTEETKKVRGLTALARAAGWALPHANICWVSERHQLLARNERGRLHSVAGPAVLYPDGWAIYAVDGVRVPDEWIAEKKLDAKTALTWQNVEQRRAAVQILGWKTILDEVGARVVHKSRNPEIGTLLEATLPDEQEPLARFLKVRCGTGREFVLRVPPTVTTALEAQGWLWNIKPEEYRLEARS